MKTVKLPKDLSDLVSKKVVVDYPTTSKLAKKARKIVKVLAISTIDDSIDITDPIYIPVIITAKYPPMSLTRIIRILD